MPQPVVVASVRTATGSRHAGLISPTVRAESVMLPSKLPGNCGVRS